MTQEIRYHIPEAGEVFLVWGVNGWILIPEEIRPAGTAVKKGIMYTPMAPVEDTFFVKVQVPNGTIIDYAFRITKTRSGDPIEIWDTNGAPKRDYHTVAAPGGVAEVAANLTPAQELTLGRFTDLQLVTQDIRYHMPEAGEVFLVWWVNGWTAVPEEIRPPGTVLKKGLMYTPMARMKDTFGAWVRVPTGTVIDYAFQITKTRSGDPIEVWDSNGPPRQDYHTVAVPGGITEVHTTLTKARKQIPGSVTEVPLVIQQIWYHMPEAGAVFLVWGINGWTAVPEEIRPPGTELKKGFMYTPMAPVEDTFIAKLQVPTDTVIDYAFQITKTRSGATCEIWDTSRPPKRSYHTVAVSGGIAEVQAQAGISQEVHNKEVPGVLRRGIFLFIGIFVALGISVIFMLIRGRRPQANRQKTRVAHRLRRGFRFD